MPLPRLPQLQLAPRERILVIVALVAIGLAFGFTIFFKFRQPISETVFIHLAQRDVAAAFHKRRLNFVILGVQEEENLSDTVMLAHADLDRRTVTLISIPRDAWVEIPGHGHEKINAAYAYGGAKMSAQVVGRLTGAHIDATIAIDPVGAKQLVDAMGGLNIDVEHEMNYDDNYGNLHIHLKKGHQYLTGGQVLGYIRYRGDIEGDWGRMRRQQQVLHEISREMGLPQNWSKIPKLIQLARKDIKTPLNDAQLQALVELYRGVPQDNVRTLTLPGRPDWVGDASVVIADDWWAKIIGQVVCSQEQPPQDVVLVVNATGDPDASKTIVGALRGGGWNVKTSIDQPVKATSEVLGDSLAAHWLVDVTGFTHQTGANNQTVLRLGRDVRPKV